MVQSLIHSKLNVIAKLAKRSLKYISIVLSILLLISLKATATSPVLRVGLLIDYKEINIKGDKGLKIFELSSGENLLILRDNKPLKIIAEPQGVIINNQSFKTDKGIKAIPIDGGLLQVGDIKYRGDIEIKLDKSLLKVINIIELEKYLYGVLKKEISPDWPAEVLKAQAIAARTFAISNMNKYINEGYNICATSNSQEYGGATFEHPSTNKAVNETAGIVAIYEGMPINSVYHSDSGGYTENCEDVWGGYIPYLRSVPSEYEEIVSPPNHEWSYSLTEKDLLSKLSMNGWKLKYIEDVVIGDKTEAGRVKSIDIFGDGGNKITLKTNDLRLLIGPNLIRSSLFTLKTEGGRKEEYVTEIVNIEIPKNSKESSTKSVSDILKEERDFSIKELIELLNRPKNFPDPGVTEKPKTIEKQIEKQIVSTKGDFTIVFNGKGSGHGVGLSQWGAYGMAKQGFNYEEILKYYYQGIELKVLY